MLFHQPFLRRILDSNQWIPYDIGSLANCWFQPLTQLSVAVTLKKVCKYSAFSQQCKIISIKLEYLYEKLSSKSKVSAREEAVCGANYGCHHL